MAAERGPCTRNCLGATHPVRLHVDSPQGMETRWARRFRDIYAEIISDLGGHENGLSEAQRQQARRCATVSIQCEMMEGDCAAGNEIDLEMYGRLMDRLGRGLQRLSPGLKRMAREVTGLGAARMLEHQEMMREEAAKRQRVREQQAAVEVEEPQS
jgi:hypothetical protein